MIIGISGKIGSGKDTVGKIIQSLITKDYGVYKNQIDFINGGDWVRRKQSGVEIKKFADKLKDIVCLLIGCTKEDLEDQEFKNKELGEEWWFWKELGEYSHKHIFPYNKKPTYPNCELVKLTPRKLLQYIGTDLFRNQLHPNVHINALFADYKDIPYQEGTTPENLKWVYDNYPNWIITDVGFFNELDAIKYRDGITIRVNRAKKLIINDFKEGTVYLFKEGFLDGTVKTKEQYDKAKWLRGIYTKEDKPYIERALTGKNSINNLSGIELVEHESETALDNAEFDYVIDNNSDITSLIEKVKNILVSENLL